jgi:hypothetical protein
MKYEALKASIQAEIKHQCSEQQMRNALFGEGKIDDMNFDWVNATNILGV